MVKNEDFRTSNARPYGWGSQALGDGGPPFALIVGLQIHFPTGVNPLDIALMGRFVFKTENRPLVPGEPPPVFLHYFIYAGIVCRAYSFGSI